MKTNKTWTAYSKLDIVNIEMFLKNIESYCNDIKYLYALPTEVKELSNEQLENIIENIHDLETIILDLEDKVANVRFALEEEANERELEE